MSDYLEVGLNILKDKGFDPVLFEGSYFIFRGKEVHYFTKEFIEDNEVFKAYINKKFN